MKTALVILVMILCGGFSQAETAKFPFQSQKGFIGYIAAGMEVEIKTVNVDSETLNITSADHKDLGLLQVRFKDFERALGGKHTVPYLNKVDPLAGKVMTLKHNLLLLPKK